MPRGMGRSYGRAMTSQLASPPSFTQAVRPQRGTPRTSWRSLGADFAYLVPGFFLTLVSFLVLVPLFALGLGTLVIWVGAPILAFMLLAASGFARENRELLRRWGSDVAEPTYRHAVHMGPRRLLTTIADPQAWKEALHGTLVAFPLRTTTFVLSVTWVVAGLGGVTYFLWSVLLPDGGEGLGQLLLNLADREVGVGWYVVESVTNFVLGALLLLLAPLVVRTCCRVDAAVARVFLTDAALGTGTHGGHGDRARQDP